MFSLEFVSMRCVQISSEIRNALSFSKVILIANQKKHGRQLTVILKFLDVL